MLHLFDKHFRPHLVINWWRRHVPFMGLDHLMRIESVSKLHPHQMAAIFWVSRINCLICAERAQHVFMIQSTWLIRVDCVVLFSKWFNSRATLFSQCQSAQRLITQQLETPLYRPSLLVNIVHRWLYRSMLPMYLWSKTLASDTHCNRRMLVFYERCFRSSGNSRSCI